MQHSRSVVYKVLLFSAVCVQEKKGLAKIGLAVCHTAAVYAFQLLFLLVFASTWKKKTFFFHFVRSYELHE